MPKQIAALMPVFSAAVLAALAVASPPASPAYAADDCLAQPNAQAPQGSHWYYRFDRVKQRRCWYLGPQGQKVRQAAPQGEAAVRATTLLGPETAQDRLPPPVQVQAPPPPVQVQAPPPVQVASPSPAVPAPAFVEPQPRAQFTAPDAATPTGTSEAATVTDQLAQQQPPADVPDSNTRDEAVPEQPVAAATDSAEQTTDTSRRLLLIIAAGLGVIGLLLRTLFKMAGPRGPRVYVERADAARTVRHPRERPAPAFGRPVLRTQPPASDVEPRDEDETLRRILRSLDRRAA